MNRNLVSIEEYLAGELVSPIKHEYLGGVVYAMAGARNAHNIIAVNTGAVLHARLQGGPCRPFNSDTKSAAVVAIRRTETGFVREVYEGLDAVIPLAEVGIDLPLAEIFESVEFAPEPDADDETA